MYDNDYYDVVTSEDEQLVSTDDLWSKPFRHLRDAKSMPNFRRGVLLARRRYDPFVKEALQCFDPELRETQLRGFTRQPGRAKDLRDSVAQYDKPARYLPKAWTTDKRLQMAYNLAVQETRQEMKLDEKVVPTFVKSVNLVLNTSSGYPHFKKKGDIKNQILHEGRVLHHHLKNPKSGVPFRPCAIGTRGALSEVEKPKTRGIWMYPADMTCAEGVYAQPLIKAYYNQKSHLFLTGVETRYKLDKFLATICGDEGFHGVGLDFSKFDSFPVTKLIYDAFDIYNENLAHGSYWDPQNGVVTAGIDDNKDFERVRKRSETAFFRIRDYFINTPLLLPNGRVVMKDHGVPSGSHFTNLVDSTVCRILIKCFAFYTNRRISELRTNGDDSAFRVSVTYSPKIIEDASAFFEKHFLMTVKPEKTCFASVPAEMHISGTFWKNCIPTRTTRDWFLLALYPSTFVKDQFDAFQRLLGIGIAGGFNDEKFCRFFDYFQTGYDCWKGPNLLDWTKFRWLEFAFGLTDLPIVYKQKIRTLRKLRMILCTT